MNYFNELQERIREIRLSERFFYQKIKDIYTTSIDYVPKEAKTIEFFKIVQNNVTYRSRRGHHRQLSSRSGVYRGILECSHRGWITGGDHGGLAAGCRSVRHETDCRIGQGQKRFTGRCHPRGTLNCEHSEAFSIPWACAWQSRPSMRIAAFSEGTIVALEMAKGWIDGRRGNCFRRWAGNPRGGGHIGPPLPWPAHRDQIQRGLSGRQVQQGGHVLVVECADDHASQPQGHGLQG